MKKEKITAADARPSEQLAVSAFSQKVRDYKLLVKLKLNLWVVFSAAMAFLAASVGKGIDWSDVVILSIGGFLVTGGANALNQVLERDFDKMMARTADRPLAAGRMTVSEAVFAAGVMSLFGIGFLSWFGPLAGFLGTVSLISYSFIYTPMKRMSPTAVLVGAIPGALPVLIGTAAAEGQITGFGLALFGVQFFWQMPHFWAIAFLADADYKKAGFQLLPSKGGKLDSTIGKQSFFYCLMLAASVVGAWAFGFFDLFSMVVLVAMSLGWAAICWKLKESPSREWALRQMFASFIFLPIGLLAIVFEKAFL